MTNNRNTQFSNFLKIEKFNSWDYLSILSYSIVTGIISFFVLNGDFEKKIWLSSYVFLTPVFLYFFCYKSLQNFGVYLVWVGFSIYHLLLYFLLIDLGQFAIGSFHAARNLKYTWTFLVFFQVARMISLKLENVEWVAPGYGGSTDLFDKRKVRYLDYVLFAIFFIAWVIVLQ